MSTVPVAWGSVGWGAVWGGGVLDALDSQLRLACKHLRIDALHLQSLQRDALLQDILSPIIREGRNDAEK